MFGFLSSSKTILLLLLISRLCFLVSVYLQKAVARRQTYRLRCHTSTSLLKDREMLPFLPDCLYGELMIYCFGFLLFSSYLEGGQFNKHAHFHSRPSQRPHSQRNVPRCRCVLHSCDPVQRLFHHNNLSGEQENPNPAGTAHGARCSKISNRLLCISGGHVHHNGQSDAPTA